MPEVTEAPVVESPVEATTDEQPEVTLDSLQKELDTVKKRLSGKDQALTAAQKERESLKAEAESLRKWKAEKELSDLTEVERLQRQLAEYEKRAADAETRALRSDLARRFPLSFDVLGDVAPLDEAKLAEIEARLAPSTEDDEPDEPRIDPNNPRRPAGTARPIHEKDAKELLADLAKMGNPFAGR